MNYRHAFHAGGFADVIKHIVLVRILTYLQEKPAAFRVIDTHAGAGRYDLTGEEARRGGEWLTGLATDRARDDASAGSLDRLRARADRAQAADRCAPARHAGARGRSRRLGG